MTPLFILLAIGTGLIGAAIGPDPISAGMLATGLLLVGLWVEATFKRRES